MNKAMIIKDSVLVAFSVAGSFLARTLGGWDTALQTLIILMAIDFVTGLLIAGVWQKSSKSETGALESKAGLACRRFAVQRLYCSSAEMKDCRLWRTWVSWACLCRTSLSQNLNSSAIWESQTAIFQTSKRYK
jgi:hypothetical protein